MEDRENERERGKRRDKQRERERVYKLINRTKVDNIHEFDR